MKKSRRIKQLAGITIIFATAGMFGWYLWSHPEFITELRQTDPMAIIGVIVINFVLIAVLSMIYSYTVRLTGKTIQPGENFLLTIYSSIANFFGPLQSGPGVRAAYLHKKHGVRLRDYTYATLLYYAIFAVINALFLFIGRQPWWMTSLFALAVATISYLVMRWSGQRLTLSKDGSSSSLHLAPHLLIGLILLTFLQVSLVACRYYTELRATNASVTVGQAISYTGAANFALFASITPDGVGVREAFLLFSQKIHGVSTPEIIKANLLDRASYIVFLALLFVVAMALHAKERILNSTSLGSNAEPKTPKAL